jgi:integrase
MSARGGGCPGFAHTPELALEKSPNFDHPTFKSVEAVFFAKLSPSAGKIKTRTARTVPLHEHLIEQGFIAFVEEMGKAPLFYKLAPPRRPGKPEPVQNPAERTRSRLGEWVRSLGITDPELSPNHAWRHTFKARAERFGISERYSDAITGHAPPTAGRAYGKPTPEDLAEASLLRGSA